MKEASGVSPFFKKTVDPGNLLCFEFPRLFLVICFRIFSSQAQLLLFIAWLVPWGKCWGAVSGMILECCLVTKRKTRVEEISNLNMGEAEKVFFGLGGSWVKIGWNYPYRWGRPGGLAIDIVKQPVFINEKGSQGNLFVIYRYHFLLIQQQFGAPKRCEKKQQQKMFKRKIYAYNIKDR